MHNTLQRLNAISTLATSAILVLLLAISLSSLVLPGRDKAWAKIEHPKSIGVMVGRDTSSLDRRTQQYGFIKFDLEADLTPLFNWNTKQLFIYLVASYPSTTSPPFLNSSSSEDDSHTPPPEPFVPQSIRPITGAENDLVLWDRIITRKEDAHVALKDERNKYAFREVSLAFSNIPSAHFSLHYSLMPRVGSLTYGVVGRTKEPVKFEVVKEVLE